MKILQCAFNVTRQSFISLRVEMADTLFARWRGVVRPAPLRAGEAVWIVPSRGFHNIGPRFRMDALYLNPEMRVVYVAENLQPLRFPRIRWGCASVLQLPAHSIFASGTQINDQLLVGSPEDFSKYWEPQRDGSARRATWPPEQTAKPNREPRILKAPR